MGCGQNGTGYVVGALRAGISSIAEKHAPKPVNFETEKISITSRRPTFLPFLPKRCELVSLLSLDGRVRIKPRL